jgi:vancomycin resistance protein VanJ
MEVETPAQRVTVYNVHFATALHLQSLVAGDFNSPPGSHGLRPLRRRLADAFAADGSGFGFTFPNRLPLLRIDYLLVSPELAVLDCRVLRTGASDHRAVVADLRLR